MPFRPLASAIAVVALCTVAGCAAGADTLPSGVEVTLVALVDLAILPAGGPGSFTLEAVDDTVLFGIFDAASAGPLPSLELGIGVHGDDDPILVTVPLVPARCDPHAVAEDKRGTLLPLRVRVNGVAGIRYFALSDELKGQLYSYVAAACRP